MRSSPFADGFGGGTANVELARGVESFAGEGKRPTVERLFEWRWREEGRGEGGGWTERFETDGFGEGDREVAGVRNEEVEGRKTSVSSPSSSAMGEKVREEKRGGERREELGLAELVAMENRRVLGFGDPPGEGGEAEWEREAERMREG